MIVVGGDDVFVHISFILLFIYFCLFGDSHCIYYEAFTVVKHRVIYDGKTE